MRWQNSALHVIELLKPAAGDVADRLRLLLQGQDPSYAKLSRVGRDLLARFRKRSTACLTATPDCFLTAWPAIRSQPQWRTLSQFSVGPIRLPRSRVTSPITAPQTKLYNRA